MTAAQPAGPGSSPAERRGATAGSSNEKTGRPIKVVAFGGGHGLAASLRALRHCAPELNLDITAVVTVGDNGGSSGRLRAERDAQLPPGDLRMALAALAGDDPRHQRTVALMQHRFALVGKPDRRDTDTEPNRACPRGLGAGQAARRGTCAIGRRHGSGIGITGRAWPSGGNWFGLPACSPAAGPAAHWRRRRGRRRMARPPRCGWSLGATPAAAAPSSLGTGSLTERATLVRWVVELPGLGRQRALVRRARHPAGPPAEPFHCWGCRADGAAAGGLPPAGAAAPAAAAEGPKPGTR